MRIAKVSPPEPWPPPPPVGVAPVGSDDPSNAERFADLVKFNIEKAEKEGRSVGCVISCDLVEVVPDDGGPGMRTINGAYQIVFTFSAHR